MEVTINDKKVRFGYGLYFLGKAQKQWDTDLQGLLESIVKNPIADVIDLMYFSAKCEAELDEIGVSITKREFIEYLESTGDFQKEDGVLAKYIKGLVESVKGNFLPDEKESTEPKKK